MVDGAWERRFLVAGLLATLGIALWISWPFIGWVVLGGFVAHAGRPLHDRLRPRMPDELAASLAVAAITLVAVVPLVWMVYVLSGDVASLVEAVQNKGLVPLLVQYLSRIMPLSDATDLAQVLAEQIRSTARALAPVLLRSLIKAFLGVFVTAYVAFGLLLHVEELQAWLHRVVPMDPDREDRLFEEVTVALDAVLYGIIVVAVLQGLAGALVWWIAGYPDPVLWGAIMFVLGAIPSVGPGWVMFPATLWAYAQGDLWAAGVLFLGGVVGVATMDNILRPHLMGEQEGLPGAVVLVGIVGGVLTMGAFGVLIGPLVFAFLVKLADVTAEALEEETQPGRRRGEP